ncbi:cupin domain-containing protein [Massilia violaceinigra]|uniref:Cupin domain-containing protein n=1 Tax=Massilia violaceinigra TaxID=2045208 RepID=A0ABY4AAM9_9BURK|nr:cupin domain-containing protein [Massilia violaceinigra]UOD31866.1 cupin domain-containing protein [Massilia violaceinigra]
MILARQEGRIWGDSGIAGVQTCSTWTGKDGDGGYLAKFQAGARFPTHAHHGWEQIFVVAGAIRFNDVEMRAGDVLQVEGSDVHEACALEETLLFVAHHGGIDMLE